MTISNKYQENKALRVKFFFLLLLHEDLKSILEKN